MKQSEVNLLCREAAACFQRMNWALPPDPGIGVCPAFQHADDHAPQRHRDREKQQPDACQGRRESQRRLCISRQPLRHAKLGRSPQEDHGQRHQEPGRREQGCHRRTAPVGDHARKAHRQERQDQSERQDHDHRAHHAPADTEGQRRRAY